MTFIPCKAEEPLQDKISRKRRGKDESQTRKDRCKETKNKRCLLIPDLINLLRSEETIQQVDNSRV